MPTGPTIVRALDESLRLPGASSRYWRDRLIGAGILPSSRGVPRDAPNAEVSLIILAVAIGFAAAQRPDIAVEYAGMRSPDGRRLGDDLAHYLDMPQDLLEFRLSVDGPAAAIRCRDPNGNITDRVFLPEVVEPPSALRRYSTIDANAWTAMAAALKSPAPTTTRRRRRRRNHN